MHHGLHTPETVTETVVGAKVVICAIFVVMSTGPGDAVLRSASKPAAYADRKGEAMSDEIGQGGY